MKIIDSAPSPATSSPGFPGSACPRWSASIHTAARATMIVTSHSQRLLVNVCQPLALALKLTPPTDAWELTPYHLNKNRMTSSARAPAPITRSQRRRRLGTSFKTGGAVEALMDQAG